MYILFHITQTGAVEELYGTRYQSDSFSLINVGSGFQCLRSFFPQTGNIFSHLAWSLFSHPGCIHFFTPCPVTLYIPGCIHLITSWLYTFSTFWLYAFFHTLPGHIIHPGCIHFFTPCLVPFFTSLAGHSAFCGALSLLSVRFIKEKEATLVIVSTNTVSFCSCV